MQAAGLQRLDLQIADAFLDPQTRAFPGTELFPGKLGRPTNVAPRTHAFACARVPRAVCAACSVRAPTHTFARARTCACTCPQMHSCIAYIRILMHIRVRRYLRAHSRLPRLTQSQTLNHRALWSQEMI